MNNFEKPLFIAIISKLLYLILSYKIVTFEKTYSSIFCNVKTLHTIKYSSVPILYLIFSILILAYLAMMKMANLYRKVLKIINYISFHKVHNISKHFILLTTYCAIEIKLGQFSS